MNGNAKKYQINYIKTFSQKQYVYEYYINILILF